MSTAQKIYSGRRDKFGNALVRVIDSGDSRELPLRLDLDNHSPTGFEWGYGGSGPAQLALAILADATGDDPVAAKMHQDFKWKVIAQLDRDEPWHLTQQQVFEVLLTLLAKRITREVSNDGETRGA